VPESGVKLTEFGYWITYPPLDPQKWSTNPRPSKGESNVVYFNPVSANVQLPLYYEVGSSIEEGPIATTSVKRMGENLSYTTFVTINSTSSDNVHLDSLSTWYWVEGNNLSFVSYNDGVATWELRFDPGVESQEVYIDLGNIYGYRPENVEPINGISFTGFVKLEIVDVDEPFTKGTQNTFTVNIDEAPYVQFDGYEGGLWTNDGAVYNAGDFESVDASGDIVYVTIPVVRVGSTDGALDVYFEWYVAGSNGDPLSGGVLAIQPFAFADGQDEGFLTVGIDKDVILNDDNWYYLAIFMEDSDTYSGYDEFYIHINDGFEGY
jgi:hypothetical protein